MDSNKSECSQRMSALVALELARLNVDIAALSEVRLASQVSLTDREVATPYTGLEEALRNTGNREWLLW
ncbi:craniofacial development protein 2 [Biomphalaria pfeifferi]|uniref:Craniofacial development protein 2 n=1 Tax=Biomphalaria pfeifferi TaxID=112525 RepID=A0AAD8BQX3_BIOPF|nr:craniofacial development protein 2 [Biomphalaria pfeifferi]